MRTLNGSGILKGLVEATSVPGTGGAGFVGVVANGQDVVELLIGELVHRLGAMTGDIDANLLHGFSGLGANSTRMGPRAGDIESISCIMPEQTFRHLTAGRIAGTENKDPLFT